jgi:hypothetical protein
MEWDGLALCVRAVVPGMRCKRYTRVEGTAPPDRKRTDMGGC